jgi:hypothetical protein
MRVVHAGVSVAAVAEGGWVGGGGGRQFQIEGLDGTRSDARPKHNSRHPCDTNINHECAFNSKQCVGGASQRRVRL